MTTTITNGHETCVPLDVLTLEYASEQRTLIHQPIGGRPDADVTLRPTTLRSGELTLFFDDEEAAVAAEAMHRRLTTFTLTNDVAAWKDLAYVPAGGRLAIRRESPHARWVVSVGFQEVAP